MPPWNIAFVIGGGAFGGAEIHLLTLLKHLDQIRFRPVLICLQKSPLNDQATALGIRNFYLPMGSAFNLTLLPAFIRLIRREKIHLIHNHGARANLLGRLSAAWLRLPNLSTVHSSLARDYLSIWPARAALALDRLTLPLATGIITVSKHLAHEVAGRGGKNIRVIYNAFTPHPELSKDSRSFMRSSFRRQWNIPEDALVLGNLARLHPAKGHEDLIQTAAILQDRYPRLHLLLVGDGPLRESLITQLDSLHLRYTLTGFLPEVFPALTAMDLFTLPSHSEGMGIVLLEAMQAGLPIAATHVGGIPEVITHEQEGLLVPPHHPSDLAAACARILDDPALAHSLVAAGDLRWPQFSVAAMMAATEDFYLKTLTRHYG